MPRRCRLREWPEVKTKGDALWNLGKFPVDSLLDLLKLHFPRLALVPGLQGDEKESVVAGADETKQAEADNAGGLLHSWRFGQRILDFLGDCVGALKGGSIRQLKINIKVALVFVG